jgi:acetolactate synthase-1/2/3 large subunit
MKASDLFVQGAGSEGVEYVFGIPGEENLDLLESLRTSSIKLILTRHEQAAGFMAATYGRLTGKAGVCLATLGPGATNFVTQPRYAQLGAMPMLMITGQKPVKVSSKQGHFQIVDIVDMMKPLTKFTRRSFRPTTFPARVREAFRRAEEERPGATHLELPEDIAHDQRPMPSLLQAQFSPLAPHWPTTRPSPRAVEAIANARRPLLMVGAGANRKTTSKMLREFVAALGIPFFTTQMGKGVLDETGIRCGWAMPRCPTATSCTAPSTRRLHHQCRPRRDREAAVLHAEGQAHRHPRQLFFTAEVDTVYFPQIEVVGDIANSVWRIKQSVWSRSRTGISAYFDNVRASISMRTWRKGADDTRFPIYPVRLVADVRKAWWTTRTSCASTTACTSSGSPAITAAGEPNTLLLDNALATMGAGLPSASRQDGLSRSARWWRSLVMAAS